MKNKYNTNKGFISLAVAILIGVIIAGGATYAISTKTRIKTDTAIPDSGSKFIEYKDGTLLAIDTDTGLEVDTDIEADVSTGIKDTSVEASVSVNISTDINTSTSSDSWITISADESRFGQISYPDTWSYTANPYGSVFYEKGKDTEALRISIGGRQFDCSNVNVSGGNNPQAKAFCIQDIDANGKWTGVYITASNQGKVYGVPMITHSTDDEILRVFDKIVVKNTQ